MTTRLSTFRIWFHALHNRIDYGIRDKSKGYFIADTRAITFARGIITILGFILISTYLILGKVTLAEYTFIVGLGSIGSVIIIFLYWSSLKAKDYQLELTYLSGWIDLTLIIFMSALVGFDNPFVMALILSYILLIPLVLSNVVLIFSLIYVVAFNIALALYNPRFFEPLLQSLLTKGIIGWVELAGFSLLFTFAVITTAIFGHKYRRFSSGICEKNEILAEQSGNANLLIQLAQTVASAMTIAELLEFLNENLGKAEIQKSSNENGSSPEGKILIRGDNELNLSLEIEPNRLYASLLNTELSVVLISILTDKLRICQAYDRIAQYTSTIVETEQMKTMGMMAAGLAHEINNPLHFMLLRCCVIEKTLAEWPEFSTIDEPVREKLEQSVAAIRKGCERIEKIVSSVRLLGKPDKRNFEKTSLVDQIEASLCILEPQIKQSGVEITKEFDTKIATQIPDFVLGQVFVNVILNSVQAVNKNGHVQIRVGNEGKKAKVSISDNGCGMDSETQKKIFQPFFTTKMAAGGTGLGLTIARKILRDYHGDIEVVSQLGQGTTVSMTLP